MIISGFTKSCSARSGGIKNIWLTNRKDLASTGFTLTGSDYTAVTMVTSKLFYLFEFDQDTAEFKSAGEITDNSIKVTHTLEFYLGLIDSTMRDSMQDILEVSTCGMVAIVEDNNGTKWVFGYSENHPTNVNEQGRPLKAKTIELGSGKAFTDKTGSTLVLECINNEEPRVFTGTIPV